MKTLQHHDLVTNQASPATLIAMATGRPVWTKGQADNYAEHYASTHQIPYLVKVLAGVAEAFVRGATSVRDAFMTVLGIKRDVDPADGPETALADHLRDVSNGRSWMASTINGDVYYRGNNKHVLPPEVSLKLAEIRQVYPDAGATIHTFATDPILEIELVNPHDGVITSIYALVWDIDANGSVVFIDPPAA